ncbi:MAG TPA: ACP phosphodiesterase [Pseudomonadales bacterium]
MNFLAHCVIPERAAPGADPDLIAGGFIGDFIKGRVPDDLPAGLAAGIRLHRRIDAYSNRHPLIRRSCERFPPELRRFAPIFVDVVADHLLAVHWHRFHPADLPSFTAGAYRAIGPHRQRLSDGGRRFYRYMVEVDLLADYRHAAAMHRALGGVLRRLGREALHREAVEAVEAQRAGLAADFLDYFPDLIRHASEWLDAESLSRPVAAVS